MSNPRFWYWHFVRLDNAGKCQNLTIETAKSLFQGQAFPESLSHRDIQSQLQQLGEGELCLRCYISNQIKVTCVAIASQWGQTHQFTSKDLFPLVLDDDLSTSSTYQSLATRILAKFDPKKSELATWCDRMVRQDDQIKKFLKERGILGLTDWRLLNSTEPEQLESILSLEGLVSAEIKHFEQLLNYYHVNYTKPLKRQRLQQNNQGKYPPPTKQQLEKIGQKLYISAEKTLQQLQKLANYLRKYYLSCQQGIKPTTSIDQPNDQGKLPDVEANENLTSPEKEFLNNYSQEFQQSLKQAVAKVIEAKIKKQKKPNKQEQFIKGLSLFYQGITMGEIAPQIGLKEQYQVSRILDLTTFRNDVRNEMLLSLKQRVLELAKLFTKAENLDNLAKNLDSILHQDITEMIEEAESEAIGRKKSSYTPTQFSQAVCQYLAQRKS